MTTLKTINRKFLYGTGFLVEVLKRDNLKYNNYEKMSDDAKNPYKTRTNDLLLLCLFVKNCKQWEDANTEENLENFYANLEENQDIYPKGLANAAESYKMNHYKARNNGNHSHNSKSGEEEKKGDKGSQAAGAHFKVENDKKKAEEEEDVTTRVTELLGLHDDVFDFTDNDDISLFLA